MPHRLYANGAVSVNFEVASGRQVDPLVAAMAFSLKCKCSPLSAEKPERGPEPKMCVFV